MIERLLQMQHEFVQNMWQYHEEDIAFLLDCYRSYRACITSHIRSEVAAMLLASSINNVVRRGILTQFARLWREDCQCGRVAENKIRGEIELVRRILYFNQSTDFYTDSDKSRFDTGCEGQYPYIPSAAEDLLFLPKRFTQNARHFIDVGCGIGDKTILFSLLYGVPSAGLEYDFYTYAIAKHTADMDYMSNRLLGFYHADAFTFDFKDFDRVFTYVPIISDKLLQFYQHIVDTIKTGTLWYEVSPSRMHYYLKEERLTGLRTCPESDSKRMNTGYNRLFERV
jgi:hypothetical protein